MSAAGEIWHVDITDALNPKGQVPLSLNSRLHWAAHAAAVDRIKAVTRNAVMAAGVTPMPRVYVELHYRPATNRFRDVDNIVATLKPAMDALHQADTAKRHPVPFDPIVPGDDPRYLEWAPPILHPWQKGQPAALWLILCPLDEAAASPTTHTPRSAPACSPADERTTAP